MNGNPIRCNYPLHWPEGWARSAQARRSDFDATRTMAQAREFVLKELRRFGAHSVEISTNVQVRPDGLPRSGQGQPADRGVAVYFKLGGKAFALACDRWLRVEDNLYAIGKHVDTIRAQNRYGVGSVEKAFLGYQRLLPAASCWTILGLPPDATEAEIHVAYRAKSLEAHPDRGGTDEALSLLKEARDRAVQICLAAKQALQLSR